MSFDFFDERFKTTTDILEGARQLREEAKRISNPTEHGQWWDKKVILYHVIASALETGYFEGDALADLRQAGSILYSAEVYAGEYSIR